jgi:hypothetical protein
VQRHVFDRFRQADDGGERNHDRNDAADLKQNLPAVSRHQCGTGEAGQRTAHRYRADGDDRERGTQIARRRFGIDRDHIGNDAADAESGDKPQPRQLREIDGIGRGEGEHAEQEIGRDQRGFSAVIVTDPAEDLRAEQDADIAGGQDEAKLFRRHVPFLDQARRGKGDGADVIAVDQRDQDRPEDELDLKRTNAVLVQKMRNLNFRLAGHRFPHRFWFSTTRLRKLWQPPRKGKRALPRMGT